MVKLWFSCYGLFLFLINGYNSTIHEYVAPMEAGPKDIPVFTRKTVVEEKKATIYQPDKETCCFGEVFPNPNLACCGAGKAYNTSLQECCDGAIFEKKKEFECCGQEYVDRQTKLCCPSRKGIEPILLTVSAPNQRNYFNCCGEDMSYNVKNNICCWDNETSKNFITGLEKSSQCKTLTLSGFNTFSSDEKKQIPIYKKCGERWYDSNIKLCCTVGNSSAVRQRTSEDSRCCGLLVYSPKIQLCCRHHRIRSLYEVHEVIGRPYHKCCGSSIYNPRTEKCCRQSGKTHNKKEKGNACCGNDSILYDNRKQICCAGRLIDLTEDAAMNGVMCCASDGKMTGLYNNKDSICCNGTFHQISYGEKCCGNLIYNMKTQLCCNGKIFPKPAHHHCCADKPYNSTSHLCCYRQIVPRRSIMETSCCDLTPYDPETHICCRTKESQVLHLKETEEDYCCGLSIAKEVPGEMCCNGNIIQNAEDKTECCGSFAYDPKLLLCCQNVTYNTRFTECCGNRTYDPKYHLCCEETVFPKKTEYGVERKCCGARAHDPNKSACCGNKIFPFKKGSVVKCCER